MLGETHINRIPPKLRTGHVPKHGLQWSPLGAEGLPPHGKNSHSASGPSVIGFLDVDNREHREHLMGNSNWNETQKSYEIQTLGATRFHHVPQPSGFTAMFFTEDTLGIRGI